MTPELQLRKWIIVAQEFDVFQAKRETDRWPNGEIKSDVETLTTESSELPWMTIGLSCRIVGVNYVVTAIGASGTRDIWNYEIRAIHK